MMMKKAVFMALCLSLAFASDGVCAKKSQDIKPDKALEEAVKVELGRRIEERELPDPMKDAKPAETAKQEAAADPAKDAKPAESPAPDAARKDAEEIDLNPANAVIEMDHKEAMKAADAAGAEYERKAAEERARIEGEQGAPIQEGEASDSSQLSDVVKGGFSGRDIETGKEGKNPDLSAAPKVTLYPRGQEAIAPNDAAVNPDGKEIEYYVFTTALDRQKWRARRLDKNIRAFIDDHVTVHVIPSAGPASSLAFIFDHLWDMGKRRQALAFLDWAYEYGRNVITMAEVDDWLSKNGLPLTGDMKIDPRLLERRLEGMNAKIERMTGLDLGWSPSRAANWHDGVIFVDGRFDPELFMRVYGEANPEKAKNFLEPHEVELGK